MTSHIAPLIESWYKDWFRNEQLYDRWARKHGLNYNELFTIYVLATTPGCTPSHIADFLSLSKQTVNSLLGRLEKRGMIHREPSLVDRRSCLVLLSEEGGLWAEKILGELNEIEHRVFDTFTQDELEMMVEMNARLTDGFSAEMQEDKA